MDSLRQEFRPEFLNRIDEVIVFHALTRDQTKEIVSLQLERVRRMASGQNLKLEWDDSVVSYLAEAGYQPEFGARELKRLIRNKVESQLARSSLAGDIGPGAGVRVGYDPGSDSVTLEVLPAEPEQSKETEAAAAEPAELS